MYLSTFHIFLYWPTSPKTTLNKLVCYNDKRPVTSGFTTVFQIPSGQSRDPSRRGDSPRGGGRRGALLGVRRRLPGLLPGAGRHTD